MSTEWMKTDSYDQIFVKLNLMQDSTTLGSVLKVLGSCKKGRENAESVMKSLTGWYSYRQDVVTTLTRRRVGDVYF